MRYALLISCCLCAAAWMNVAAEAQAPRQRKQTKLANPPQRAEEPDKNIVWPEESIKGWGRNQAEAEEDALQKAQLWVLRFLRKQHPAVTWKIPTSYVREHLVTGPAQRDSDSDQVLGRPPDVVKAECWALPLTIQPDTYQEMLRMENQHLVQLLRAEREARTMERMSFLAKLLAAIVALLAAIAGYLRLEDWTKGYYTWWLRAAVIGFLGFIAAGLMFVG